jgi:hypothetical protein
MNAENFCYWLQGWLEIQNPSQIDESQLKEIKNHLDIIPDRTALIKKWNITDIKGVSGIAYTPFSGEIVYDC